LNRLRRELADVVNARTRCDHTTAYTAADQAIATVGDWLNREARHASPIRAWAYRAAAKVVVRQLLDAQPSEPQADTDRRTT
jgi:hypothetical protein